MRNKKGRETIRTERNIRETAERLASQAESQGNWSRARRIRFAAVRYLNGIGSPNDYVASGLSSEAYSGRGVMYSGTSTSRNTTLMDKALVESRRQQNNASIAAKGGSGG